MTTPPTLCMILKGFPRISETFISNEILLLEQLGFTIRIVSMRHPRESFAHASISQIKARADYLPSTIMDNLKPLLYHNILLFLKQPGRYWQGLKKAGRRWLRTRKSATLKHLLQAGYLVHHLLPGSGVVHFHAHFAHSPTSVAMFASILSGIPFSFFAHAKDIYTSDPRQLHEKISLARFVVTCTQYNQRYLFQVRASALTPVFCVYHGINLAYFSPGEIRALPSEPFKLLTVARLTEKKGLDVVCRALRILKDRGIPFFHTLIGEGDDRPGVEALIRDLDLEGCTTLLGTLTHEAVISHYARSDLFVLGCKVAGNQDRDGIPNVMAESMAMNLPVVATRVSGIPELLRDGVTGLLVEPEDPAAMADAMERLLQDETLRRTVIRGGRETIARVFDNSRLIRDLAGIYSTMIPALERTGTIPVPGN
ncbi:MAG: glycosyltransferase family 4 protein [Pseudomonadota bacterium]